MNNRIEVIPATETTLAKLGGRDTRVSEAARAAYEAARPENTARAYDRAWGTFAAWCDREVRTALPATAETLWEYVHQLTAQPTSTGQPIAPRSVEQVIAAIRTRHEEHGYQDTPTATAALRLLRGYRRSLAEAGRRDRKSPPITGRVLRRMVRALDTDSIIGVRDRFILVAGMNMMARRSELAALNLDEVTEDTDNDDLVVWVRASKTDQDAHGREVRLPRAQYGDVCPIRTWRAWVDELDAAGCTEGRLLRSVDRHGEVGASLSPDAINRIVRSAAVRAELPGAERYTAHSLRAGGATQARKNGADMTAIAEHGRWNPRSPVVYGYIRAEDAREGNVMRGTNYEAD